MLDTARVTSAERATEVAARQWRAVVTLVVARGRRPIIRGDRWDACAPFLARMSDVEARCLLRVTCHRVFSRVAPARRPGQIGASRTDGDRFPWSDQSTHGEPDETWEVTDAKGARVHVRWWRLLHLRTARVGEVSLIPIIRHGASESARDPTVRWCVWRGDEPAPLAEISPTSRLRSSQGHGSRCDQHVLRWDVPRLSTPERTERWTQVVGCAHHPLGLARPLLDGCSRPWEMRRSVLTVSQVRRAMPTPVRQLDSPARPPLLRSIRAGTRQRLSTQAQDTSSGDPHNEEKAENEHKDGLCVRLSE